MTIRRTATVLSATLAITTGFSVPAFASPARPPIIGGHTVTDAPWAASVYQSGSFACSGTIIAPTWVLTAKHCTKSNSITARVGSPYRSRATTIGVTHVEVSPNSDLALLQRRLQPGLDPFHRWRLTGPLIGPHRPHPGIAGRRTTAGSAAPSLLLARRLGCCDPD